MTAKIVGKNVLVQVEFPPELDVWLYRQKGVLGLKTKSAVVVDCVAKCMSLEVINEEE
jgi:hypothetical protein